MAQPSLFQLFWAAGLPEESWQSCAAVLKECGIPQGLEQLAGPLQTQEALPHGSPTWKDCRELGRCFHCPARLVVTFLGCGDSCRELAVLCSCSERVWHPPRAGAASWATANPRGSSSQQPNLEGLSRIRQMFSLPGQACYSFSGVWGFLLGAGSPVQFFCGSAASPTNPRELEQLARPLRTQEALTQGNPTWKD